MSEAGRGRDHPCGRSLWLPVIQPFADSTSQNTNSVECPLHQQMSLILSHLRDISEKVPALSVCQALIHRIFPSLGICDIGRILLWPGKRHVLLDILGGRRHPSHNIVGRNNWSGSLSNSLDDIIHDILSSGVVVGSRPSREICILGD